jgi:hypothetical protein
MLSYEKTFFKILLATRLGALRGIHHHTGGLEI